MINSRPAVSRLFNRGFCLIAGANFLLFLAFYCMMPVLPYFLRDLCHAANSAIGLVIACYSVSCILIRPVAGWMLDAFRRRPIYLIAYTAFMLIFTGYAFTATITAIIAVRLLHGISFGVATVGGTTIVTYLIPQPRLGEGLGLYGLANTVSMAVGPMLGLWLQLQVGYTTLFLILAAITLLGLLLALSVPVPHTEAKRKRKLTLRTLILVPALVPSAALLLASIPYGLTTSYISLLADEYALSVGAGLFYGCMALGLGISRVFGGRLVDKWNISYIIMLSFSLIAVGYVLLTASRTSEAFLISAFMIGLSFGVVHPAFNTLFVRMGGPQMRGAATSTYLTAWDLGIGLGIVAGGIGADNFGSYHTAFVAGVGAVFLSLVVYYFWMRLRK